MVSESVARLDMTVITIYYDQISPYRESSKRTSTIFSDFWTPISSPKSACLPQHDGMRTTMKKGTPKILSKSISRMTMGSLVEN